MRGVFADRAALTLAVLLFAGLELLTAVRQLYWPMFILLMGALGSGVLVALRDDLRTRGPHVAILPLAYLLSAFLMHLFVSRGLVQQLYIVGVTVGFLLLIARATEWAYPTWTWFFTSATFFLFSSGMYGLTFHVRFPLWLTALGIAGMTGLLTYHVVGRVLPSIATRLFWSALFAFLIVEFLAVLSLFPLAYLAVGGVLFVIFYVLLHLLQRHLYERVTPGLVAEYVGLAVVVVLLVMLTAEWRV